MTSKKYAALHTIHLVSIDANNRINQKGCGCLLNFRNQLFLLSVAHIETQEDIALHLILHNDPRLGYAGYGNHYRLNPTRFKIIKAIYPLWISKVISKICSVILKKDPTGILFREKEHYDFLFDILKLPKGYPIFLNIPQNSPYYNQLHEIFDYKPFKFDEKENYCLYGLANFCNNVNGTIACQDFFVNNLKYLKIEKGYAIFKMNGASTNLKGCSGAPIIDSNGNLVSILVKLHTKRNMICGVDLRRFVPAMHIAVNDITGEQIYE